MGTRPISQKMKKMSRSSEPNNPSMAASMSNMSAIYGLTFSSMVKEAKMASGVRMTANSMSGKLMPSTPTW